MDEREKARFDAFANVRDFWHARWISRRDYAWKVTIAAWALLAGAPLYIRQRPPEFILAAALLIYLAVFTFWVRVIEQRDHKDSRLSIYFNALAEQLLVQDTVIPKRPSEPTWFDFLKDNLALFQVVTAALLALAAFWLIGHNMVVSLGSAKAQ